MSGWYDPYSVTAVQNYLGLTRAKRGPQALVLGAFTHGRRSARIVGDVDLGAEAPLDSWAGDWMRFQANAFTRALDGELPDGPRVRYFLMGGGSGGRTAEGRLDHGGAWRDAADWPPPEAHPITFHLHADGTLRADAPPRLPGSASWTYDPSDPVPTVGGPLTGLEPFASAGAYDQRAPGRDGAALVERPDVRVFRTAPLERATDVVGTAVVDAVVSTDAPDTDFTAKLIDEHPPSAHYPDGYAMNLSDGIVRLRYVADPTRETFTPPGRPVRLTLELPPIANRFAAGHRIRLDLSSSNFPRYDPNPNTGEPEGRATGTRVARNTVHVGADGGTRLTLHVLPWPVAGGE